MAYKKINDMLNDLNKVTRATSNKVASMAQDVFTEHIMEDVYEYYDDIRGGYFPEEGHYERTWGLLNSVKVKRSRNKAFISIDYDPIILGYIREGSNDWRNSIIYNLPLNERKRDFYEKAKREINGSLDEFVMRQFDAYNLKVKRRN